ncbi:hypothetical protein KZO85_01545 [Chromohalobacter canadensis]|uniref:hypothetical protein n=1 Tax=Chromohalobacter canadensis TaxID=141389 RepID=UPI0021BF05D3|nr:hypothetical protein [Chromohalobacter canadensis]MCT8467260.1 hypothetical protein [Chromohalobacter canadensis]MCT8470992.1 hypothetical protein [Chromohalobacter canadensis]MCT8497757.1 hypothetical protein [Chromohalobacter canadensis]
MAAPQDESSPTLDTGTCLPPTSSSQSISEHGFSAINTGPAPSQRRSALKEQRTQELLDHCRDEALRQLIGPFGLTPAMFDDVEGGNVTTQHNASQDVYAKTSEKYNRDDYDYQSAKRNKKRDAVKNGDMNSDTFTDAYTGEKAPTKRTTPGGKQAMNAELDHTVPLKQAHKEGGWMLDEERRQALASDDKNLNYTTLENNRKKSDAPADEALSSQHGYDETRTRPLVDDARTAIDEHLPDTKARATYHAKEIGKTGAREFGKMGLRRAMGLLLHELINGVFSEIKIVINDRQSPDALLDRLTAAIKRVAQRVQSKFKAALDEFFKGGIQGFISNLLTFLINNLITTSAKVVTIIREGLHQLWDALKMMLWPPEGMSREERLRAITKSFAGLFTLGAGMVWEESLNAFLLGIPPLAPIAGFISPVIAGLLTGLATALLMYAIDSLIDWMLDKGTAYLNGQIEALEGYQSLIQRTAEHIDVQFQLSASYKTSLGINEATKHQLNDADNAMANTNLAAAHTRSTHDQTRTSLDSATRTQQEVNAKLSRLLNRSHKET